MNKLLGVLVVGLVWQSESCSFSCETNHCGGFVETYFTSGLELRKHTGSALAFPEDGGSYSVLDLSGRGITSIGNLGNGESGLSCYQADLIDLLDLSNNLLTVLPSTDMYAGHSTSFLFVNFNNNQISTIPQNYFSGAVGDPAHYGALSVFLANNSLSTVGRGSFADFDGLTLVADLSNNSISTLTEGIFEGFTTTQLLVSFDNNQVAALGDRVFSNFSAIRLRVTLNNNVITAVNPSAFDGFDPTSSSLVLELNDNELTSLSASLIGVVQSLSVQNNNIETIPDEGLNLFPKPDSAINNPLECASYSPTLSNCSCTDGGSSRSSHATFIMHCGYGFCSEFSSGCPGNQVLAGECGSDSSSSSVGGQCIQNCSTGTYFSVYPNALPYPTVAWCLPLSVCTPVVEYQLVPPSPTSDRVCQTCATCAEGYTTVACTATSDASCVIKVVSVSHALSAAQIVGIVFLVIVVIIAIIVIIRMFWWGNRHKEFSVKTTDTLNMTERLLEAEEHKVALTEESWKISFKDIDLGVFLGEGQFGRVSKARWCGSEVAVKILEVKAELIDIDSEDFQKEASAMQALHHPNLVTFYGFGTTSAGKPFMVTELMNQTLRQCLVSEMGKTTDWSKARRWCTDITAGMLYLHTRNPPMIHRDLKSDNCLLGDKGIVKIADFGTVARPSAALFKTPRTNTSTYLSETNLTRISSPADFEVESASVSSLRFTATVASGTPLWMAPEVMVGKHGLSHYGLKVDVYSFGMVMFEIATRELPFPECHTLSQFEFDDFVISGGRPQTPTHLPFAYSELMQVCWNNDPDERPTFNDVARTLSQMAL
eukprot:m.116568 g.116568  ORF g.116568 m.116568 type:complete len:825 (+) comp28516_c0_seq3:212-2686(+)